MLLVGQLPQKSSSGRDQHCCLKRLLLPCLYLCAIEHTCYRLTHWALLWPFPASRFAILYPPDCATKQHAGHGEKNRCGFCSITPTMGSRATSCRICGCFSFRRLLPRATKFF